MRRENSPGAFFDKTPYNFFKSAYLLIKIDNKHGCDRLKS